MGSNASAHIAYGYDLGSEDDFRAVQRSEYGSPKLPWYDPEDDDENESDPVDDFLGLGEQVLLESVGFTERWVEDVDGYFERKRAAETHLGAEFQTCGSLDYPGWLLVAKDSGRNVSWAEAMTLDLDELRDRPSAEGWDLKLAAALTALGITPIQDGPRWLVFPSYG